MAIISRNRSLWESEYQHGEWSVLHGDVEFVRYEVLAGYIQKYRRRLSLFDVGCGEGVILKHLNLDLIEKYTGLDIAQAALDRISPRRQQDRYICSALEEYRPDAKWDVVLFNEILYYTHDPAGEVRKFEGALNNGGFFLISMHKKRSPLAYNNRCIRRLQRYFRQASYRLPDAVRVSKIHQRVDWEIYVVQPPATQP